MLTIYAIHAWNVFKMTELTEMMRQKNDLACTKLLNRVRTASQTDDDIKLNPSRSISHLTKLSIRCISYLG